MSKQIASGISNYLMNIFKYSRANAGNFNINTKLLLIKGKSSQNIFFQAGSLLPEDYVEKGAFEFYSDLFIKTAPEGTIFHSPYMFLPRKRSKSINLLTVHDLINLENTNTLRSKLRAGFLHMAIMRADYFICISHTTKSKLQDLFPEIEKGRIFVISQGIDSSFLEAEEMNNSEAEITISKPYILYVGQRSGYKNFSALLSFLAATSWSKNVDLICVGGGEFTKRELQQLKELRLEKNVRHSGYVSTTILKALYKHAFAFVYTSLEEGFGIPILEAMASGCPVICGNFSSMKEVSNGHAIAVEDFSPDSLSRSLEEAESFSQDKKDQAKMYAKNFSWKKTASETLSLYSRLLARL